MWFYCHDLMSCVGVIVPLFCCQEMASCEEVWYANNAKRALKQQILCSACDKRLEIWMLSIGYTMSMFTSNVCLRACSNALAAWMGCLAKTISAQAISPSFFFLFCISFGVAQATICSFALHVSHGSLVYTLASSSKRANVGNLVGFDQFKRRSGHNVWTCPNCSARDVYLVKANECFTFW